MRMVSMTISGIRCSDYERKALVAMMQGKERRNKTIKRTLERFSEEKWKG